VVIYGGWAIFSAGYGTSLMHDLLRLVRDHRQVENCLYWMKDRWWDEDKHYFKRADDIFVEMTNAALSLLRVMQKNGENLLEVAEKVHFEPKETLKMLGFKE
jgi:hypothetical protein